MSLEPYQYRPATPPKSATPSPTIRQGAHCRHASVESTWSSPESAITRATTPNVSPLKHSGPVLLPKVRARDQGLESEHGAGHRRAQSHDVDASLGSRGMRPGYQRSTTTPPEYQSLPTPLSATSVESWNDSIVNNSVDFSPSYGRGNLGHARSTSTSAIDAAALRRYGYPCRSLPVYVTQTPHYTPSVTPGLADFVSAPLIAPPHPLYRELTPELLVETGVEPTNTIHNYFTEPNPAVDLVPPTARGTGNGQHTHCWWDIRNLRTWDDFNLDTIMNIPGFSTLLKIDVNAAALPEPALGPASYTPTNLAALHDTYNRFYAHKVNAALRACQGQERHAIMKSDPSKVDGPHFQCGYANDIEATLSGNGRSRVIGLVKPYEVWNTGKRRSDPTKQVEYLAGLAHLQRMMREHSCRYGFIMTEIELVCVRMGTEEGTPYFGLLELSEPIEMRAKEGLTTCLALWYLHMLTSDAKLPGQCGWKVDVGPPAAWTRSHALEERDDWIPTKTSQGEMRQAKTRRGWVWPKDQINRLREGVSVRGKR